MAARRFEARRRVGGREAAAYQMAIAYDGERTEDEYFRGWKLLLGESRLIITPYFVRSGGNPLEAVKASIKLLKKSKDCAEFWCVSDVDDAPDGDVAEALRLADVHGIKLCLSRRSFEIWIGLHFKKHSRPMASEADAISIVKQNISSYDIRFKSVDFNTLWPKTNIAIANADWLSLQGLSNPSTKVHGLIRKLRDNLSPEAKSRLVNPS